MTNPEVFWPTTGQEELFDGTEFYQPHTEWPGIPHELMTDDEVYGLLHDPTNPQPRPWLTQRADEQGATHEHR